MIVAYMCHPVSGDVAANLARAKAWLRWLNGRGEVAVIAPWIVDCEIWDDDNPEHREAGLRRDEAVIARCEMLILVGGRISDGMRRERDRAAAGFVRIVDLTPLGPDVPDCEPPRLIEGPITSKETLLTMIRSGGQ